MTYTIDESLSDTDFTPNGLVGAAFGTPRRYESITVHHWGSFGQTHMGVVDFFMQPNSPTSAHFVASDNLIHCLVSPQDASWAAGNAYGNATSIHIESRPEATDGDYATIAWLISHLRSIYGDLPLKPHSAWASTACPGIWNLDRLDREARGATVTTQGSKPDPIKEDTLSAAEVNQIIKAINAVPTKVWAQTVNRPNGKVTVIQEVADAKTAAEAVRAENVALRAALAQYAASPGAPIDYDAIGAAVTKALADGTVQVDINVAGGN